MKYFGAVVCFILGTLWAAWAWSDPHMVRVGVSAFMYGMCAGNVTTIKAMGDV